MATGGEKEPKVSTTNVTNITGEIFPRIEKLTKSNWELWKFCMTNYNSAQGWTKIIEGKVPEAHADFKAYDAKAKTAIAMSLDQEHLGMVLHCTTSKQMWDTIKAVKEQSSDTSIMLALCEYHDYKYKSGQAITEYVSGLNLLVMKLKALNKTIEDSDVIAKMLHDLPPTFESFKANWRMNAAENTDMVTREKFLSHLLAAEQSMKKVKPVAGEALYSKGGRRGARGKQEKEKRTCFSCGKSGHLMRDCWNKKSRQGEKGERKPDSGNNKQHERKKSSTKGFMASSHDEDDEEIWYADGGCSFHMAKERKAFSTYQTLTDDVHVKIPDGTKMRAVGVGTIDVYAFDGEEWNKTVLHEVYHIPSMGVKYLFSLGSALDRFGYEVKQNASSISICDDGQCVLTGERLPGGLWTLDLETIYPDPKAFLSQKKNLQLWHERLAHTGREKLLHMQRHESATGFDLDGKEEFSCDGCKIGRMIRKEAAAVDADSKELPGEHWAADLCGDGSMNSLSGFKYFMIVKDQSSCFRSVYFLKTKDDEEVAHWLKIHFQRSKTQTGRNVKTFRSDGGGEFCGGSVEDLLNEFGIMREKTIAYSPYQNGAVERDNRTIREMANTMLHSASLPTYLWAEMVNTAVYIHNRVPNRKDTKSPHELFTGKRPYIGHLRVIGSKAFVHIPKNLRKKFDQTAWEGVVVGYGNSTKFYRIYNPEDRTVTIAKDVAIVEKEAGSNTETDLDPIVLNDEKEDSTDENQGSVGEEDVPVKRGPGRPPGSKNKPKEAPAPHDMNLREREKAKTQEKETSAPIPEHQDEKRDDEASGSGRKSIAFTIPIFAAKGVTTRVPKKKKEQKGTTTTSAVSSVGEMEEEEKADERSTAFYCMLAHTGDDLPQTVSEALSSPAGPKWLKAMDLEYESLIKNKTWILVPKPEGKRIVSCKWVFTIKRKREGEIVKYKARLCARGFTQVYGVDFKETFAPVVRHESIRILLAVAAQKRLNITSFDVGNAFLHGKLEEQIHMHQPEHYEDGTGRVCLLQRSIYGLVQSPRVWNERMNESLKRMGMKRLQSDRCVYIHTSDSHYTLLMLWVDDGCILSDCKRHTKEIITELMSEFQITVTTGERYIGIEIDKTSEGDIIISQTGYLREILKRFCMQDCHPIKTPVNTNPQPPTPEEEKPLDSLTPYQERVGAMMYGATVSRPDLSFAVGRLAQQFNAATRYHMKGVQRVFRYIRGTEDQSIMYTKDEKLTLEAHADADWAGSEEMKSTSGVLLTLNKSPVLWYSRLQSTVATSTTVAEHNAMYEATRDVIWTRNFLEEIGEKREKATPLFNGNQAAVTLTGDKDQHKRTKHILTKIAFMKENREKGIIEPIHKKTDEMPADILTKGLTREAHERCMDQMRLKKKSERGVQLKALFLCLLIMHDVTLTKALFDPHPPIIWKKSDEPLVGGVNLITLQATLISPCDKFDSLQLDQEGITYLKTWCETTFYNEITKRLDDMGQIQAQNTHRAKRDIITLAAGAVSALAAVPGLGWVALAVGSVVIVGITGYACLSSRTSDLEDRVEDQEKVLAAMKLNQETLRSFAEKVKSDMQTLESRTQFLLSQLKHMPSAMAFTADVASKLSTTGDQMQTAIDMWNDGKVSRKLFQALNITLPCGRSCPVKLMQPMSWSRKGNETHHEITMVIVAPIEDRERVIYEPEAITLFEQRGDYICFMDYSGPSHVTVSKDSKPCDAQEVGEVYQDMRSAIRSISCNNTDVSKMWKLSNCTQVPMPEPQWKRLGTQSVVYCKGFEIQIDGGTNQTCPDYPFTLSVCESFISGHTKVNNTGIQVAANNEITHLIQNKLNGQMMRGLDAFSITLESIDADLSFIESSDFTLTDKWSIIATATVIGVTLAAVLLLIWYLINNKKSNAKIRFNKKKHVVIEVGTSKDGSPDDQPIEAFLTN